MKRIFVGLLIFVCLAGLVSPSTGVAEPSADSWQPAPGPNGGSIAALALSSNYVVDHTVFAGLRGQGIYRTLTSGTVWERVSPDGWIVADIELSSNYGVDTTVFATVGSTLAGYTLQRSTDGGDTWNETTLPWSGVPSIPPRVVVSTDYASDQTVYVIAGTQSFVSTNGGATFAAAGGWFAAHNVIDMAFSPAYATDQTIYALDATLGLFVSTNAGASFNPTGLSGEYTTFAVSPDFANDDRLLAVRRSDGQVRQSTNGGASWSDLTIALDPAGAHTLRFSPTFASNGVILAASSAEAGVYRTTNSGAAWTLTGVYDPNTPGFGGFIGDGPYDVVVSGADANDARAFAGTSNGLYTSLNRGENWFQATPNLAPLTVRAVAAAPGDPDTLIAGTSFFENRRFDTTALTESDGNLHRSVDGGQTWQHVTGRLQKVNAVAFSPDFANDATVFATAGTVGQHGFFDGGLYRSTDGGQNWSEVRSNEAFQALAVSPQFASDDTAWASAFTNSQAVGVYRTTNGGDSWSLIGPSLNVQQLVVSPNYAVDSTLFAGTPSGVQKSTNGGANWTSAGLSNTVTALAISPAYGASQTLYAAVQNVSAGTPGTLHHSTNGGATWTQVATGAPDTVEGHSRLFTTLEYAHDGSLLTGVSYSDVEARVYRSVDGGTTWTQVDGSFDDRRLHALASVPSGSMTFYAGTSGQLWQLDVPQGDPAEPGTWTSDGPRGGRAKALALSPTYSSDGIAFAGDWIMGRGSTETGLGMLKSTDGGMTWIESSSGTEQFSYSSAVHDYAVSPVFASDSTVFAATWGGLFKSTDAGATWEQSSQLFSGPPGAITNVAVAPDYATSEQVLAGSIWGTFYRSDDAGQTWTGIPLTVSVSDIAYSPDVAGDDTAFMSAAQGIYKTSDHGLTWTGVFSTSMNVLAVSPNYINDETVFAGNFDGVYITTDGGTSWISRTVTTETPGVQAIAPSPTFQNDELVFAGNSAGLFQSNDGGMTWSAVSAFPGANIYAIGISPAWPTQNTILAGTDEGVYISQDGGGSWTRAQGLATLSVGPLARSNSGSLLLAGAPDYGVFASTDGGATWEPAGFHAGSFQYTISAFAISPAYPGDQTLFTATRSSVSIGGSIHRSTDGGKTWENVFNTDFVGSLAISPNFATNQTIYGTGNQGRVVRSTDGGDTWSQVGTYPAGTFSPGITQVALPPAGAAPGLVFGAGNSGFWRLPAGASEWQPAATGLNSDRSVRSIAVSPDYAGDQTLLAAASWFEGTAGPIRYGVYRSTDGGVNWTLANTGLPFDTGLQNVAFSPTFGGDKTAYALDDSTLYRSVDGGLSWTNVGTPPGVSTVSDLVIADTHTVYVSTDVGVWRYTTPAVDIITNGGFEVNSGWSMPSTAWTAGYSDKVAYDGARSGRIGIDNGSNVRSYSSARQTVTIPASVDSATLTFYHYPVSGESAMVAQSVLLSKEDGVTTLSDSAAAAGDAQYVLVMQPNSSVILETLHWDLSNAQSWQTESFDLTKYAGQSVVLHFGVFNDGAGGRTGMYVDNVSLLIETERHEAYLPVIFK